MAHWAETAIFWHVYPLGFVGAPPSVTAVDAAAPRLRRLNNWLDYLIEQGMNGLLLGPSSCPRHTDTTPSTTTA